MAVKQTFFWYDLETSGTDPRTDRVMQFAGQRTTLNLEPIGEPVNLLIKMTPDVLPQPDAILITGITPQMTLVDGMTEAEFLRIFTSDIATPGTIFVGYNTVRFDDEFMRFLHYRNFYDAYAWEWQDNRGRWDLLDVVRMTRALRPDGITWPVVDGKATNRLSLITKANGIDHEHAHDALSDVHASIEVARLIRERQPKLFQYLFDMRGKQAVAKLIERGEPFVYSSGKYDSQYEKTTVAVQLCPHPVSQGSLVYDLRHDPSPFLALSAEELAERWQWTRDERAPARLPVKSLLYNRCPAVAPLSVLDAASSDRLHLDVERVAKHHDILREHPDFTERVLTARQLLDERRPAAPADLPADVRLYDGFFDNEDGRLMSVFRVASPGELADIARDFHDERLRELAPLYKARNYPKLLEDEERAAWETYCYHTIMDGGTNSRLARYMHRLQELASLPRRGDYAYILEELQLYAESIMPAPDL